ncbi:hypothetical protein RFI_35112, partial [Reticulomyxa filosa]
MKLNKKQFDDVFECLNGLKDENECIRALCKQSLETISTKLNDQQFDRVFSAFIDGLKYSNQWNRGSYARSLGIIAIKTNKKQLNDIFECLNGLEDENEYIRVLCEQSLETMSTKLNDKQFDR